MAREVNLERLRRSELAASGPGLATLTNKNWRIIQALREQYCRGGS